MRVFPLKMPHERCHARFGDDETSVVKLGSKPCESGDARILMIRSCLRDKIAETVAQGFGNSDGRFKAETDAPTFEARQERHIDAGCVGEFFPSRLGGLPHRSDSTAYRRDQRAWLHT